MRTANEVKHGEDTYTIIRNLVGGKFYDYALLKNGKRVDRFNKFRKAQKAITAVKKGEKVYA